MDTTNSEKTDDFSDAVRAALAQDQPVFEQNGMKLVLAENGRAIIRTTATANMLNAPGMVHGGVAYVMADAACAYALRSIGPPGVTQNANITYLNGAREGMQLEALGSVVKAGRRMATLKAEVRVGETLIALGTFNFVRSQTANENKELTAKK